MAENVLIIDDAVEEAKVLQAALSIKLTGVHVGIAFNEVMGLKMVEEIKPSVVILDLSLDDTEGVESGFRVLRSIRATNKSVTIYVLTGHDTDKNGIKAYKNGANGFIKRPAEIVEMEIRIKDGLESAKYRQKALNITKEREVEILNQFIGTSDEAKRIREQLVYASKSDLPFLITGESGTGKTTCARIIFELSEKMSGKFVTYAPYQSGSDIFAGDLYGHKRGAFTGAENDKNGLLKEANDGLLFIDEIGDMPLDVQISLLTTIESKEYRAVGSNDIEFSNFRLITATNKQLSEEIKEGRFREDFYYRIAGEIIDIPPLRNRPEDIRLIIETELRILEEKLQMYDLKISNKTYKKLIGLEWRGNARDIKIGVERAVSRAIMQKRQELELRDFMVMKDVLDAVTSLQEKTRNFKRACVRKAIEQNNGDIEEAARSLKISRATAFSLVKT